MRLFRLVFHLFVCLLLVPTCFSQIQKAQPDIDKSLEILLSTTAEDFTRGFIEGFDNSIEIQIASFEQQTAARKDLSESQKAAANSQFRRNFSTVMARVRVRVLDELKIAEIFKKKLAEYYKENYSEEELVKLAEFMSTPLGRKVMRNQDKLTRFIMDFSRSFATDERFLNIVKEESTKKDPAQR